MDHDHPARFHCGNGFVNNLLTGFRAITVQQMRKPGNIIGPVGNSVCSYIPTANAIRSSSPNLATVSAAKDWVVGRS